MPSTVAWTDVKIWSNACLRLGAKSISAFTDQNDRARLGADIYPAIKDNILSLHDWTFIVEKATLSRLTAAPDSGWTYQFQLPPTRLIDGPLKVFDTDAAGATAFKDFEIQQDKLLADVTEIWIDYFLNNTVEANWPPYFIELMIKACMAEAAMPLTDQAGTAKALREEVYGTTVENGRGGMMGRAIARNNRETPPQVFTDFTLIQARAEGQ